MLPDMLKSSLLSLVLLPVLLAAAWPAHAQSRAAVTADDYAHAEKFLGYNTNPLVSHFGSRPVWIADDRFWYRTTTPEGYEYVLFDASHATRQPVFDPARLASALSSSGGTADPARLPLREAELSADAHTLSFSLRGQRWKCDLSDYKCASEGEPKPGGRSGPSGALANDDALSPDKKRLAFVRDFNLWARDTATGQETQLTTDGVKDFGYATDNAGWVHSDRPILLWSPDSTKIATFQQDQRGVGEMYLVETKVGHPTLQAWKYPLPGDEVVATIQRVIVDLNGPKVVRLKMPPDQHRSSLCDHVACRGGEWADVEWSP